MGESRWREERDVSRINTYHVQEPNNLNKCKHYMPQHETRLIILTRTKMGNVEGEENRRTWEGRRRGLKKITKL